ncbi:vitamin-D-receptor interacting mediator subunit 4-domain-containing protein [Xylaria cf. heliscus]|nr:vitamin-D-receptor interacting mediator subunit 4-domain-containing protein [Xylaria cf. heliscus]
MAMNKQLDARFDRVEKALGTLIDSIAKYNPSLTQVQELGDADAELSRGLEDLETHQSNYQRIQELRALTGRYDAQIRDTLRLLANTRKELVNASATVFPSGPSYEIRYDELLSYARRISKTTIPPVGAVNAISALTADSAQSKGSSGEAASAPETAATTPAGGTPNGTTPQPQPQPLALAPPTPANGDTSQPTPTPTAAATVASTTTISGTGTADLPSPLATFLNPHSAYTFVPWPSEEQIRHGAIASLAYMAEQGIEPEGYDPEVVKALRDRQDEERRAAEDRERADREDRERRLREEHARARAERERLREREQEEAWRRASVSIGAPATAGATAGTGTGPVAGTASTTAQSQTQPKAQFQFMGDDDDDDDD